MQVREVGKMDLYLRYKGWLFRSSGFGCLLNRSSESWRKAGGIGSGASWVWTCLWSDG